MDGIEACLRKWVGISMGIAHILILLVETP